MAKLYTKVTAQHWINIKLPLVCNSLWPSDALWLHRSGSTLAKVMAYCLTTPSNVYLFCGNHLGAISQEMPMNLIRNMHSEIPLLKLPPHLPGASELNTLFHGHKMDHSWIWQGACIRIWFYIPFITDCRQACWITQNHKLCIVIYQARTKTWIYNFPLELFKYTYVHIIQAHPFIISKVYTAVRRLAV